MSINTKWIGPCYGIEVGTIGFLICFTQPTGAKYYMLRDTPALTNNTYQPKLYGWCGSHCDKSTDAFGMAKVIKVARNNRILVETLEGDELIEALEELGYPDLAEQSD